MARVARQTSFTERGTRYSTTMRTSLLLTAAAALVAGAATTANAGTVTRVAVSPERITAGGTVTVTVSGTNPCGAAHLVYGDGEAVTYAITGLPYTQSHVYARPGTYTITLTVSDGVSRFENELPVTVQQKDRATPTPTTGAR